MFEAMFNNAIAAGRTCLSVGPPDPNVDPTYGHENASDDFFCVETLPRHVMEVNTFSPMLD